MNFKLVASNFLFMALLISAGCSKAEDPLKKFQGEWTFIDLDLEGKKADAKVLKFMTVKIEKNTFKIYAGAEVGNDYTMGVDNSRSPAEIDLVNVGGENAGTTELGIYYFEGNRLKILTAGGGLTRPTAFTGKAESGHTLMVLERKE